MPTFRQAVRQAGHENFSDTATFNLALWYTPNFMLDVWADRYADAMVEGGEVGFDESPSTEALATAVAFHVSETWDPARARRGKATPALPSSVLQGA